MKPEDLAASFLKEHKDSFFWRNDFYIFDGMTYHAVESLPLAVHRHAIGKKKAASNSTVSTAISHICAMRLVAASRSLPSWKTGTNRDADTINFRNGVLVEGQLIDHTPDYLSTFCLPFDYLPDAECPHWMKFLGQVFSGDEERIELLQEWFGYCLMNDARFEKFLLKVGPTRSGKGTVDKVLQALIGEGCVGYSLGQLANGFGLSNLIGKRVALIGEAHVDGRKDRITILEKLKSVVGGDIQQIDRKYKEPINAALSVKFSISANKVPSFYDGSTAFTTRMLLLKFDKSFAGKEDLELLDRLKAELPGIANWAMAGKKRLLERKRFTEPASTQDAMREITRDSSPALAFVQDCLLVQDAICPSDNFGIETTTQQLSMPKASLEKLYERWSADSFMRPIGYVTFMKEFKSILPDVIERQPRINGKQVRYLYGVAPKTAV